MRTEFSNFIILNIYIFAILVIVYFKIFIYFVKYIYLTFFLLYDIILNKDSKNDKTEDHRYNHIEWNI